MKTFKACVVGLALMLSVVSVVDAKSRVSSSSRSFSKPSVSRTYTAPKPAKPSNSYNGGSFFSSKPSAPKATAPSLNLNKAPAVQSKPTLKSLGFTKPATGQTVNRPSAVASPKPYVKAPTPVTKTSSSWFGQKKVVSTPTKTVVTRKVSSPVAYRSSRPVVIQRNYYNNYGGYNGYNRGYGGHYGGGYGYNSGMGTSMLGGALGAFGGMMIYDALTDNSAEKALQAQVNQLQATNNSLIQTLGNQSNPVVQQPQCFLPPDAPLMMDPKFYCQPAK
jgi:hypothetical protein